MMELCVNYLTVLKKKLTFYGRVLLSGSQQTTFQVITLSHF